MSAFEVAQYLTALSPNGAVRECLADISASGAAPMAALLLRSSLVDLAPLSALPGSILLGLDGRERPHTLNRLFRLARSCTVASAYDAGEAGVLAVQSKRSSAALSTQTPVVMDSEIHLSFLDLPYTDGPLLDLAPETASAAP